MSSTIDWDFILELLQLPSCGATDKVGLSTESNKQASFNLDISVNVL